MFPKIDNFLILIFAFATIQLASAQLYHPCNLNDYKCIGNELAARSNCSTENVWGSIPNAITFLSVQEQIPYYNVTAVDQYRTVMNLDSCYVSAFFFNLTTNVGVLSINCPGHHTIARRTIVKHNPNDFNDYYSYDVNFQHNMISFTTNYHRADRNMQICSEPTYAYLYGNPRSMKVTPRDRPSAAFYRNIYRLRFKLIYERESYLTRAATLMRIFVEYKLCASGCNINEGLFN